MNKQEIANNVWLLPSLPRYGINAYIIDDVLIDSKTKYDTVTLLRQMQGMNIRQHVLTHAHIDHMGSSHEICQALKIDLLCGQADKENAEMGCTIGLQTKPLFVQLEHKLLAGAGQKVSGTLQEGDQVGSFVVVETPGHSAGHLSFFREQDGVLIVGDVLFNCKPPFGGLMLAPNAMTLDPIQNRQSASKLVALNPNIVCFGHGPPVGGQQLQRFAEQENL